MPVKPAFWESCLSYFIPLQKEKVESKFSGTLTVVLDRGEWKLETSKAIYSHGNKYPPFLAGIQEIGFPKNGAKILLLGIGTGSALDILSASENAFQITVIDIDPIIISLAKKYANISPVQEVAFVCSDASEWVSHHDEKFDLIFVDIFIHNITPDELKEESFLLKIKSMLNQEGNLIYSQLNDTNASKESVKRLQIIFAQVFPNFKRLQTPGNQVFVWQEKS